MNDYRSNTSIADLAARLLAAKRVLITSHAKPDGDAMGSCLGLARVLEQRGKVASIYLAGPIERSLMTIAGTTPFSVVERQMPDDEYDLAVVVDTGAWSQLEAMKSWLQRRHHHVLGIDHHSRGDADVAAMRIIEPHAVSTTAVLVPILEAMGFEFLPGSGGINSVPEAIFAGLATDSGWFRYPNATADAFMLAAKLLACGVDKPRLYQILEENYQPSRLAIESRALASLQYARCGAFAIATLTPTDFTDAGVSMEDLTGVVNLPMAVGAVRVSILIAQAKSDDAVKLSFRSKPAPPGAPAHEFIDVNVLAAKFGGGGHIHAAGAKQKKEIDMVKADVLAAIDAL